MKQVLCFGEALIDFINTGRKEENGLLLNSFTQFPGGAPANAAVAVSRLGGNASFAGQVGDDQFGHFLMDALKNYGVDTSFTYVHPTAKTALAFVFLDDLGERSFSFRRDNTADIMLTNEQVSEDWFVDKPIVHFCSNTLTDPSIANVTRHFASLAKQHDATISFDVNLRHNLWPTGSADKATVTELVELSDIVKFSLDELLYLSDDDAKDYLTQCFSAGVSVALVTDGARAISIHTTDSHISIEPPKAKAIDTTGAGDAFIGAVLYGLSKQADPLVYLSDESALKHLVCFASHCGALTVTRSGAFVSFPEFHEVQQHWEV